MPTQSNQNQIGSTITSTTRQPEEEDNHYMDPSITTTFPLFGTISLEIAQQIHDEFLICKICLDAFDNPKSLACLHTFCKKCIENHISAEVTYNKSADYHHFTCPLCRKRTNLPIGGVRKLPDNFLVSGLADMMSQSKKSLRFTEPDDTAPFGGEIREKGSFCGRVGYPHQQLLGQDGISGYRECEICGQIGQGVSRGRSSTPSSGQNTLGVAIVSQRAASTMSVIPKATWKCLDCSKMLCDQCVKRHKEIRVTKDHAIFSLATESAIACLVHPEESVRFYCENCSVCVCVLCTFNDHREHEMKSFGEATQKLREELDRRVSDSQAMIQNTRQQLSVIDKVAKMVNGVDRDVRQCAVRAVEEIRRQENQLIEQLYSRVGQPTMQTIEKSTEWSCQLSRLETVHSELVELLEGQDLDVLLNNRRDIKAILGELMQLEVPSDLPFASCPNALFAPQPLCLGRLIFPDGREGEADEHFPHPETPTSRRHVAAAQTEPQLQSSDKPLAPLTKANAPPIIKQVRHRAVNTEIVPCVNEETSTRPRGVNVSITFGGDEQVDNYLLAIKDIEVSDHDSAFAAMDNLTRARVRRILKERWNTVDTPETSDSNRLYPQANVAKASKLTNPAKLVHRRLSDNRALKP